MNRYPGTAQWAKICYGVDPNGAGPLIVRAVREKGSVRYTKTVPTDNRLTTEIAAGTAVFAGYLTTRESLTRWLTAPFDSTAKTEKVLPSLLDVLLPFPLEDCVYHFFNIQPNAEGKTRALAAVARRTDIEKKLKAFQDLGVDPVILDQEGLALWTQSLHEIPFDPPSGEDNIGKHLRVIINLADNHTTLVVGDASGYISAHGTQQSNSEDLVRVLKTALPERPTSVQWVCTGPRAADQKQIGDLTTELTRLWPGSVLTHDDPEYFMPRAIATRALLGGPLRCNLRSGHLAHSRLRREVNRQSLLTRAILLAAGLLLCVSNIVWRQTYGYRVRKIDATFQSLAEHLRGQPVQGKGADALRQVSDSLNERLELMSPFLDSFDPSLTVTLASITSKAGQLDIRCELLALSREKASLTGCATGPNQLRQFSSDLKQLGFSNVEVKKRGMTPEGLIRFTMEAEESNE